MTARALVLIEWPERAGDRLPGRTRDAVAPAPSRRSGPPAALRGLASVITLVLEASTYAGSAALLRGDALLGERVVAMRGREHEALMPAVAELLGRVGRRTGRAGSRRLRRRSRQLHEPADRRRRSPRGWRCATGAAGARFVARASWRRPTRPQTRRALPGDARRACAGSTTSSSIEVGGCGRARSRSSPCSRCCRREALPQTRTGAWRRVIGPGRHAERAHVVPRAASARRITNMIDATAAADLARGSRATAGSPRRR